MKIITIFGFGTGDGSMRFKEPVTLFAKVDPSMDRVGLLFVEHLDYQTSAYGRSCEEIIENWVSSFTAHYNYYRRQEALHNELGSLEQITDNLWTDEMKTLWAFYKESTEPGVYPPAECEEVGEADANKKGEEMVFSGIAETVAGKDYLDGFKEGFYEGRNAMLEILKLMKGILNEKGN